MTNKIIGIFGGGQLGKMICFEAHKLGFKTAIFCPEEDCVASQVTNKSFIANYDDYEALDRFIDYVDLATLEFENIPTKTIEYVARKIPVFPSAEILRITQNRLLEKGFLRKSGVEVTDFLEIKTPTDLKIGLAEFGFKAILKTATMGYDGKGQFVLNSESNLEEIFAKIPANQPLILEKFANFEQEISVMIARNENGEISCFEPLTNIHKNGILDESFYPAKIDEQTKIKSQDIASKIALGLNLVGILAIEFFVLKDGKLLVNELAPRPHNSGHFSMDGAVTCQFEQLIRAINNLPFGNTKFLSTGQMKNLIGEEINNLEKYYQNPNAKIHIYGKKEAKDGRKMGHVNLLES